MKDIINEALDYVKAGKSIPKPLEQKLKVNGIFGVIKEGYELLIEEEGTKEKHNGSIYQKTRRVRI